MSGTMERVEPLGDEEATALRAARLAVQEATAALREVERGIATAHGMKAESWMEWRSWCEFDGKFIVYRFQSHQG